MDSKDLGHREGQKQGELRKQIAAKIASDFLARLEKVDDNDLVMSVLTGATALYIRNHFHHTHFSDATGAYAQEVHRMVFGSPQVIQQQLETRKAVVEDLRNMEQDQARWLKFGEIFESAEIQYAPNSPSIEPFNNFKTLETHIDSLIPKKEISDLSQLGL